MRLTSTKTDVYCMYCARYLKCKRDCKSLARARTNMIRNSYLTAKPLSLDMKGEMEVSWSEVRDNLVEYEKLLKAEMPHELHIFSAEYVFDVDKSVRWNREEAARRNQEYKAACNERAKAIQIARERLIESAVEYIQQELKVPKEKANRIFDFCNRERHSGGYEAVLDYIDELIEVLE